MSAERWRHRQTAVVLAMAMGASIACGVSCASVLGIDELPVYRGDDGGDGGGPLGDPDGGPWATAIAAGRYHACAVLNDGTLRCWGNNERGAIGAPAVTPYADGGYAFDGRAIMAPVAASVGKVAQVGLGENISCAVLPDAKGVCWGDDAKRALGRGTAGAPEAARPHPEAKPVTDLGAAEQMGAGLGFACALSGERVFCWGTNGYYVLGVEQSDPYFVASAQEIAMPGRRAAKQLAVGGSHVCALLDDAHVACWGNNWNGQLGRPTADGGRNPQATPLVIPSLADIVEVRAGDDATCARAKSGRVSCFGKGHLLGRGTADAGEEEFTPAPVVLPESAKAIAVGPTHACAILVTGGVRCWGEPEEGKLGSGQSDDVTTPLEVLGLPGPAAALATASNFTCALLEDHTLWCWGGGSRGQGNAPESGPTPLRVSFGSDGH
ncbi:RCC1 domain-containing protein [Pendulispora albinea]|uniref:RCC1-like domain-containing protein n=1 Tax=Pendulispora albinea TaxID=2741071 RepID=A0ABZ2M281_9BACT